MTSLLVQALDKISYWMEYSNSEHAQNIRERVVSYPELSAQPGLEKEMLELYAEEISLNLTEEIYELYQWKNGMFMIGDSPNPTLFVSFEWGFCDFADRFRSFPIFKGDDLWYFVEETSSNKAVSPIYIEDGVEFSGRRDDYYSPSITAYMQAMAECVERYNEISVACSGYNGSQKFELRKLFSSVYEKYGIETRGNVIWT